MGLLIAANLFYFTNESVSWNTQMLQATTESLALVITKSQSLDTILHRVCVQGVVDDLSIDFVDNCYQVDTNRLDHQVKT